MIYKVLGADAWERARRAGRFEGSEDDLRDGYIHFSTRDQLAGTLAKYFAGRSDLILAAVEPSRLGERLRWEPARDGALFPHLYAPLELADVAWAEPLGLDERGRHRIPSQGD